MNKWVLGDSHRHHMYQEDDSPQPILYEQRHEGLVWATQFHIRGWNLFNNEGMEERHTDLSSTISDLNLKYRK